jgi:hypothetical protein
MPPTAFLLAAGLLLGLVLVIRKCPASEIGWDWPWAKAWRLPLLAGVVSALLTVWIWGGLRAPAVWHDEAAYLLQAELISTGQFAGAAPPIPEAFTQAAVLVTPVLAPKMVPGHAIILTPGVWLGLPGLMPVLLVGLSGALLVLLTRQYWGAGVSVIALALWLTQAGQQRWRTSYLSESTTGALWLLAWWFLIRWRDSHQRRWLLALAFAIGWGAISRPLTMLAFFIPIGIVVLHDAWRLRLWRDVALAAIVGTGVLSLVPLQNLKTLGSWRSSPLTLYTAQYMPFDRMGFGLDSTPPTLRLSPELERAMEPLRARHAEHRLAALPQILGTRLAVLQRSLFGQWRILLIPAALVGLLVIGSTGWVALTTVALLYGVYLGYAHEPQWSAYYAEAMPVFAAVMAVGTLQLLRRIGGVKGVGWVATTGVAAIVMLAGAGDFAWARRLRASAQGPFHAFHETVAAEGVERGLIFIHHAESTDPHVGLVRNVGRPESAEYLTAHDRGGLLNRQVAARFPDRQGYRYDTGTGRLQRGVPE